jgi:ribosome biogenesis GTPase A
MLADGIYALKFAWKGANFAVEEFTGKKIVDHATDALKDLASEKFKEWFDSKFTTLTKAQRAEADNLIKTLQSYLQNVEDIEDPDRPAIKRSLAELVDVICNGLNILSTTTDKGGFGELVRTFVRDVNLKLQGFHTALHVAGDKYHKSANRKLDQLLEGQKQPAPPGARMIFAGNPGAGKSTLLNALFGRVAFKAGMSQNIGEAVTMRLQWEWSQNIGAMVGDTPGLKDPNIAREAAQEIAKALDEGGPFRLVFFVSLNDRHQPRVEDLTTLKVVLDAVNIPDLEYGIVVNKVNGKAIKRLQEPTAWV